MAEFIYGTEINLAIEDIILQANEFLMLVSPYIKLHDRIKSELRKKIDQDQVQVIIVFGKNENDISKSFSIEDVDFIKEFPNVLICYERNLHAKYYANEKESLLTSMNLHQFSHNTNIEAGVIFQTKTTLQRMAGSANSAGEKAFEYFDTVIEQSEVLFRKTPKYESTFLGLKQKYVSSEVELDKLNGFFGANYKNPTENVKPSIENFGAKKGYCIRTGVQIPYNLEKPMCNDAWKAWSRYKDVNYTEKYCHYSGEPSNGETSFARPILRKYWNKAINNQ